MRKKDNDEDEEKKEEEEEERGKNSQGGEKREGRRLLPQAADSFPSWVSLFLLYVVFSFSFLLPYSLLPLPPTG